jgi:phenylalanyl-tRNA synthetase alpha chain
VQIRAMERRGVPIRIIAPGKVFRRDTPDMTHVPMFHQIEGLCVDKGITMAHLKGHGHRMAQAALRRGHGNAFRPSYFPFTEPSAEFDFSCFKCHGTGQWSKAVDRCRPAKARLDRTRRLRNGASERAQSRRRRSRQFIPASPSASASNAWPQCMFNIDDIRHMFENDVRFLEQFR